MRARGLTLGVVVWSPKSSFWLPPSFDAAATARRVMASEPVMSSDPLGAMSTFFTYQYLIGVCKSMLSISIPKNEAVNRVIVTFATVGRSFVISMSTTQFCPRRRLGDDFVLSHPPIFCVRFSVTLFTCAGILVE